MWRYTLRQQRERMLRALVWHLPREIVAWCVIRAFAHATMGRWDQTEPDALGYGELLRRWEIPDNRRVMPDRDAQSLP